MEYLGQVYNNKEIKYNKKFLTHQVLRIKRIGINIKDKLVKICKRIINNMEVMLLVNYLSKYLLMEIKIKEEL